MVFRADVLKVMIASPGDVIEERDAVRDEVNGWNYIEASHRNLILLPVRWDTHVAPELSGRPQSIINERILDDADILVGIFWTRLGTPTGQAESGTVEEIQKHHSANKPTMVYFSSKPIALQSVDLDQYKKVKEFQEWCSGQGIYETFENLPEFKMKFSNHLRILLANNPYLQGILRSHGLLPESEVKVEPAVSDDALRLLRAASDGNGDIFNLAFIGGNSISANGIEFVEKKDNKILARWKAALQELEDCGFVSATSYKKEIFTVSHRGYQYLQSAPI